MALLRSYLLFTILSDETVTSPDRAFVGALFHCEARSNLSMDCHALLAMTKSDWYFDKLSINFSGISFFPSTPLRMTIKMREQTPIFYLNFAISSLK
jgi:hypothetical protein